MSAAMVSDRLDLGRSIPGGGTVTDEDWQAFEAVEVAPRFRAGGYSVSTRKGSWQGQTEDSLSLEVIHPKGDRAEREVLAVAKAYKRTFGQHTVMRTEAAVTVDFI